MWTFCILDSLQLWFSSFISNMPFAFSSTLMRWTQTVGGFLSQGWHVTNRQTFKGPTHFVVPQRNQQMIWKSIDFVLKLKYREDKCLAESQWERRWDGNMSCFHRDVREAEWIKVFLLWCLQAPMMDLIWVKRMCLVKKGRDEATVEAGRWLKAECHLCAPLLCQIRTTGLHYKHGLEVSVTV